MRLIPELIIGPSDGRPRTLRICWQETRIVVSVYGRSGFGPRYAFSMAQHDKARLDLSYELQLWLDSSCFDLSEPEALQIRTVFEPLGLRIQTRESTHSAASSRVADREATATAARSPRGDGGTTPPAVGLAGGALDDENRTFVHALTCGEEY